MPCRRDTTSVVSPVKSNDVHRRADIPDLYLSAALESPIPQDAYLDAKVAAAYLVSVECK